MPAFYKFALSLTICGIFFVLCLSHTVRSDHGDSPVIRLPGNDDNGGIDICAGTAEPTSCPVTCFRTNPVCGMNGITYWCGCHDAACAGARVAKLGFCEVGNVGSGSLSGQTFLLVHIVWLILLGFSIVFGPL